MPTALASIGIIASVVALWQGTPARSQTNSVSGSAMYEGTKVTFTRGVAWWKADDHQVRIGLFDHDPPAGILTKLRAGSWGDDGPIGVMYVELTQGATVSPASVKYCFVDVDFPKAGPMGWNADSAKSCGLNELGGTFKPGGTIVARVKGQASGSQNKPFSWDVRFNLPIAR